MSVGISVAFVRSRRRDDPGHVFRSGANRKNQVSFVGTSVGSIVIVEASVGLFAFHFASRTDNGLTLGICRLE